MVRNAIRSLALIGASLIFSPAKADDLQLWTALFADGAVRDDSRLLLWFDGHARYSEDVSRLGVSILRPGVGWRVNDGLSVWAGYAYVVSRADGRANVTDHRIWQQATYRVADGAWGRIAARTRLEQRFVSTGNDTGYRLRQFVRFSRPLAGTRWTATGWNETFIALNDTDFGARSGYDQNRTFAGLNYRLSDSLRLEGGYLFNHINRDGAPDAFNHAVSMSISAGF